MPPVRTGEYLAVKGTVVPHDDPKLNELRGRFRRMMDQESSTKSTATIGLRHLADSSLLEVSEIVGTESSCCEQCSGSTRSSGPTSPSAGPKHVCIVPVDTTGHPVWMCLWCAATKTRCSLSIGPASEPRNRIKASRSVVDRLGQNAHVVRAYFERQLDLCRGAIQQAESVPPETLVRARSQLSECEEAYRAFLGVSAELGQARIKEPKTPKVKAAPSLDDLRAKISFGA